MNLRKSLFALGLALAAILAAALSVEAQGTCKISTTPVSFGTYNVFATTPLDTTGSVTYRCVPPVTGITIVLSRGSSSTFSPRTLVKGTESLNYNLYLDAARTRIWGDGTGGTQVFSDPNPQNNQDVTVTIFGRILAGQDVSAGTYADTVTATITF